MQSRLLGSALCLTTPHAILRMETPEGTRMNGHCGVYRGLEMCGIFVRPFGQKYTMVCELHNVPQLWNLFLVGTLRVSLTAPFWSQ
jgi:hypothetical protein